MVLTREAAEARLVLELADAAEEAAFLTEAELTDPNQFANAVINNLPAIAYALHAGLPAIAWKGATKNQAETEMVLRAVRQWGEQTRLLLLALIAGAITLGTFYERMAETFRRHARNSFTAGKRAMGNLQPLTAQDITLLDDTTADDGLRLDAFLRNPASAGGLGGMLVAMVTDPSNFLGSGLPGDPFAGLPPPLGAGKGKEHAAKDLGKFATRMDTYGDRIRAMAPVGEMAALADIPGDATLVWWTLGGQDHCVDCLALSDMSPFYSGALSLSGISPGSGHTRCGVKCHCNLEYDVPSVVCADAFGTGPVGLTPADLLESADGTRINVWVAEAAACANPVGVESFDSVAPPLPGLGDEDAFDWEQDVVAAITKPGRTFTMRELRELLERRIVQRNAGQVAEQGLVRDPEAFAAAMSWLTDLMAHRRLDDVRIATYELEGTIYHAASTRTAEAIRFEVGHTTAGLPVLESDFAMLAMRDLAAEAREAGLRFEVNGVTSNEGMVAWLDTLGASRYDAGALGPRVRPDFDQQLGLSRRVQAGVSPEPSFMLPEVNELPAWPELSLLKDDTPAAVKALGGGEEKRLLVDPTGQQWLFKPTAGGERDAAAARLANRLGLRTPPITVVEYDGVKGSLQPIIRDAVTVGDRAMEPGWDELRALAGQEGELIGQSVLDYVIGNLDGHAGNYIVDTENRIWGIDKSRGFIGAAATSGSARQFHASDLLSDLLASKQGFIKTTRPADWDVIFNRLDGLADAEFLDIIGPDVISQVAEPFGTEADKAARLLKRKAEAKATHEQMVEELLGDAYDKGWSIPPEWTAWEKAGSHFGGAPIAPMGQPERLLPAPPAAQKPLQGIATAEVAGTAGNDLAVASVGFVPPPSRYLAVTRLEAALPMTNGNILEGFDLAQLNAITDRAEVLAKMGVDMTLLTRLGDFSKVPAADRELGIGLTYKNKIALDSRHEWKYLAGVDSPDTVYNDMGGLFAHEYGHVLVNGMDAEGQLALIELFKANVAGAADLSTYAKADLHEWAGEVFAAITTPGYVPGTLAYDDAFWTVMVADNKAKAATKTGLPGPAHQPKPKAPDKAAIPTGELEEVRNLGGSTGAMLVKDSSGARFVDKRGNSAEHLREEVTADAAYRAMGFPVPRAILIDTPSGPLKRAAFVEEAMTLDKWWGKASAAEREAMQAQLQAGMAMDALIGNWDVIGMGADNILVTKGGRAIRVDNGGSFRYRAQGALKDKWGAEVTELARYRDVSKATWTTRIFGTTTDAELRRQILVLEANRDALLRALPEELRATTGARLDTMLEMTKGVEPAEAQAGLWKGPGAPKVEEPPKPPKATEPVGPPIKAEGNAWGPGDPQQYLVGDSALPLNAPVVQWSGHVPTEPPLPDLGATPKAKEAARAKRDAVTKTWEDVRDGTAPAAFSWSANDAKEAKDAGLTITKMGGEHIITKGPEDAKAYLDYLAGGGKTADDGFWHLMGYSPEDLAAYDEYDNLGKSLRLTAGVVMVEPDGRLWVLAPKNKFGGYENTVIKGGVDEGESAAAGAVREMMEEAGFSVELDSYLGDYVNDTKTGIARMYVGHRTGGGPLWAHEKETYKVRLLTADEARAALKQYGKPTARDQSILADAVAALEGKPGAPVFTIPVEDLPEFVSKTAPGKATLGPGAHETPKKGPLAGIAPQPGPNPPLPTAYGYDHELIGQLYGHQVESPASVKFPMNTSRWVMPDGTAQAMYWKVESAGPLAAAKVQGQAMTAAEKKALDEYVGPDMFWSVSGYLRGGQPPLEGVVDLVAGMDGAMAKAAPWSGDTLYRGLGYENPFTLPVESLKPGASFVDKGFASTSKSQGLAASYGTLVMKIEPSGVKALDADNILFKGKDVNKEVVLDRNTRYTVTKVETVTVTPDAATLAAIYPIGATATDFAEEVTMVTVKAEPEVAVATAESRIFWANSKKQVEDPHLRLTLHVAQLRSLAERIASDSSITGLRVNEALLVQVPKMREMLVAAGGSTSYGKYIDLTRTQVTTLLDSLKAAGPFPTVAPHVPSSALVPPHVAHVPGTANTVAQSELVATLETLAESHNPAELYATHLFELTMPSGKKMSVEWRVTPAPTSTIRVTAYPSGLLDHEATTLLTASLLHLEPVVAANPALKGLEILTSPWHATGDIGVALTDFALETATDIGKKTVTWTSKDLTAWADKTRAGLKGEALPQPAALLGPSQAIPEPPMLQPVELLDPAKLPEAKGLIEPDDYPLGLSGGVSSKVVLQDPSTGGYYLFKQGGMTGNVESHEVAAQALARDLGHNVPAIRNDEYLIGPGQLEKGTLQVVIPNVHTITSIPGTLEEVLGTLTPAQMKELTDQSIVDFITWNIDTHSSNWLIDDTGKLWGIDRNGALASPFSKVPSDDVRTFYSEATKNPGGYALMRQVFDDPATTGILDKVHPAELKASIDKVMALSDAHITSTLQGSLLGDIPAAQTRVNIVLERRQKVAEGYAKAFTEMVDKLGPAAPADWRMWREGGASLGADFSLVATAGPAVTSATVEGKTAYKSYKDVKLSYDGPGVKVETKVTATTYEQATIMWRRNGNDVYLLNFGLASPTIGDLSAHVDRMADLFTANPKLKLLKVTTEAQDAILAAIDEADVYNAFLHSAKAYAGGKALNRDAVYALRDALQGDLLHAAAPLVPPLGAMPIPELTPTEVEKLVAELAPTKPSQFEGELEDVDELSELVVTTQTEAIGLLEAVQGAIDEKVALDGYALTRTAYPGGTIDWRRLGNDFYIHHAHADLSALKAQVVRLGQAMEDNPKLASVRWLNAITPEIQAASSTTDLLTFVDIIQTAGGTTYAGGISMKRDAVLKLRDQLVGAVKAAAPTPPVDATAIHVAAGKLKAQVHNYVGSGDMVQYATPDGAVSFVHTMNGPQLHIHVVGGSDAANDPAVLAHIAHLGDEVSAGKYSSIVIDDSAPASMQELFLTAGATGFDDGTYLIDPASFMGLANKVDADIGHEAITAALAAAPPVKPPTIHELVGADVTLQQTLALAPVDQTPLGGNDFMRSWHKPEGWKSPKWKLEARTYTTHDPSGDIEWVASTLDTLGPAERGAVLLATLDNLAGLIGVGEMLRIRTVALDGETALIDALKGAGAQQMGDKLYLTRKEAQSVLAALANEAPLPVVGAVEPTPIKTTLSAQLGHDPSEAKKVYEAFSSDSFAGESGTLVLNNPATGNTYDVGWHKSLGNLEVLSMGLAGLEHGEMATSAAASLPRLIEAATAADHYLAIHDVTLLDFDELRDIFTAVGATTNGVTWVLDVTAMDKLAAALVDNGGITPAVKASAAAAVPLPASVNPLDHLTAVESPEQLAELIGTGKDTLNPGQFGGTTEFSGKAFSFHPQVAWSTDSPVYPSSVSVDLITGAATPKELQQTAAAFMDHIANLVTQNPTIKSAFWAVPNSPVMEDALMPWLDALGAYPTTAGYMKLDLDGLTKGIAGITDTVGLSPAATAKVTFLPQPVGLLEKHSINADTLASLGDGTFTAQAQGFGKVTWAPPGSDAVTVKVREGAGTLRWVGVSGNTLLQDEAGIDLIVHRWRDAVFDSPSIKNVWFDRADQMTSSFEDLLKGAGAIASGPDELHRLALTREQFLKLSDQLDTDVKLSLAGAPGAKPLDVADIMAKNDIKTMADLEGSLIVGLVNQSEYDLVLAHLAAVGPALTPPAWSINELADPEAVKNIGPSHSKGKLPVTTYMKQPVGIGGSMGYAEWKNIKAGLVWQKVELFAYHKGTTLLEPMAAASLQMLADAAAAAGKPLFIADEVIAKVPALKTSVVDKFAHLGPGTPKTSMGGFDGYLLSERDTQKLKMALDAQVGPTLVAPYPGVEPWPGFAAANATPPPATMPPVVPPSVAPGPSVASTPTGAAGEHVGAAYGYDATSAKALADNQSWDDLTHDVSPTGQTVAWQTKWSNGVTTKWAEEQQGIARILRVRDITSSSAFATAAKTEAFAAGVMSRWKFALTLDDKLARFVVDKKAIAGTGIADMLKAAGFKETKEYWVITRQDFLGLAHAAGDWTEPVGFAVALSDDVAPWVPASTIPSAVPAQPVATPVLDFGQVKKPEFPQAPPAPLEPAIPIVVGPAVAPVAPAGVGQASPSFIYGYGKPNLDKTHAGLTDAALPADAKGATPHTLTSPNGIAAAWSVSPSGKTVGWSTLAVPPGASSQVKVDTAFGMLRRIASDMEHREGNLWVRPEVYDQVPGLRQLLIDAGGAEASFPAIGGTAVQMTHDQAMKLIAAIDADAMTGLTISVKDVAGYLGFDPLAVEKVFAQEPIKTAGRFTWNIGGKKPSNLITVKGTEANWTGVALGDDTTRALAAVGQLTWFVDNGIDDLTIAYDAYAAIPKLDKFLIGAGATVKGTSLHLDAEALNTARKLIARDRLPVLLGGEALPYSVVDELVAKGPDVLKAVNAETLETGGLRVKAIFEVTPGTRVTMGYSKSADNLFWQSADRGSANLGQTRAALAAQLHSFTDQMAQSAGLQRLDVSLALLKEHPNLRTVLRKYGGKEVPPSGATEAYVSLNRTQALKLRKDLDAELASFSASGASQTYIGQQAALIVWPVADDLGVTMTTAQTKAKLGGQTAKAIFTDKAGNQWLFKPGASGRGAATDQAAAKLAELLGLSVPPVKTYTLMVDGKLTTGSLQKMLPKAKGMREAGIATAGQLTPEQTAELFRHSVLDWVIANDDAHMGNWLIDENGKLWSIDKSRGWESFGGRQDVLATASNGNGGGKPWLFQFWADAKKDPSILGKVKPQDLAPTLRKLRDMPDAAYERLVAGIAPLTRNPKYAGKPAQMVADMVKRKREATADFERYFAGEVRALLADPATRASVPKVWSDWAKDGRFNLDSTPRDVWMERRDVLNARFGDYTPQRIEDLYRKNHLQTIKSEITSYFGGGAKGHASGQYGAELIRPRLLRNKMDAQVEEWQALTEWGLLNVVSGKSSLSPANDALVRKFWDPDKGTFRLVRTTDRYGTDPRKYIEGYTKDGMRDMVGTALGKTVAVAGGGGVVLYIEVPANQVFSGWIFGHGAGGIHGGENEFLVYDARVDQIVGITRHHGGSSSLSVSNLMAYNGPVIAT